MHLHASCVLMGENNNLKLKTMTFDKFTIKAQETVQEAVRQASSRRQQAIEPEHLLAAILSKGEQVTQFIFRKLGVNLTCEPNYQNQKLFHQ